ncbi:MAG: ammonia-forming cytochrome c nitrite reductase subunit c552, partial [Armatimonadota bacterium]
MLNRAEDAIIALHLEIGEAMKRGASDAELEPSRKKVSVAQMYWDYVAANNGMGFHAPQECARVLAKSIDIAQQGRLLVAQVRARRGQIDSVKLPDISSKLKAQAFIKPYVDMQKSKEPHNNLKPADAYKKVSKN